MNQSGYTARRTPDRQPCKMSFECTGNDKVNLDVIKGTLMLLTIMQTSGNIMNLQRRALAFVTKWSEDTH